MEFSRPKYWSGLPFPSLGDLLNPGIKSRSPILQADSLPSKPPEKPQVGPRKVTKLHNEVHHRMNLFHKHVLFGHCGGFAIHPVPDFFFKFIYFNWRLITFGHCGGFAIHPVVPDFFFKFI